MSFNSPINKSLANFLGRFPNTTRVVQITNVWDCPQVTIGLAAAWLMALMLCLPPLFRVAPYNYNVALAGCAPDFATGNAALWYSAVYTTLTLILPAALILGCNIKVQYFTFVYFITLEDKRCASKDCLQSLIYARGCLPPSPVPNLTHNFNFQKQKQQYWSARMMSYIAMKEH